MDRCKRKSVRGGRRVGGTKSEGKSIDHARRCKDTRRGGERRCTCVRCSVIWQGSLIRGRVSSQSVCPTEKFSSRSPGAAVSPNKIICIRATNYLTNSSAYRAIKWPLARPPSLPMLSLLSSPPFPSPPFFLASSRRCLDTLWRHPHDEPLVPPSLSLSLSLFQERGTYIYARIYHPPSLPRIARFFIFGSLGAIERSPRAGFEFNKEPFPSRVIYNPARKLFS